MAADWTSTYFAGRTARYGGKLHLMMQTIHADGRKSLSMACGCPNSNNGSGAARCHERFSVEHVNCVAGRSIVARMKGEGLALS